MELAETILLVTLVIHFLYWTIGRFLITRGWLEKPKAKCKAAEYMIDDIIKAIKESNK